MKLNIVPARTGFTWFKEGAQTFFRNPLALSGTYILVMIVLIILSAFSLAGSVAALVLLPAATLIMMSATRQVSESPQPPTNVIGLALADARACIRDLFVLGLLYAAGYLAIMGITYLIDGGALARVMLLGEPLKQELAQRPGFTTATWVAAILSLPLSLMFWHAPGLVYWHKIPPAKALFFSLVACMRNWRAYAVFMLVCSAVITAIILVTMFLGMLMVSLGGGMLVGNLLSVVSMSLMLVLSAIFLCSIYFPLRDSFIAD